MPTEDALIEQGAKFALSSIDLAEFQSDVNVPEEVDVCIIGGGIIGVNAAFYLAGAGLRVAIIEKGAIGGEQSGRNWGWVRQMGRDLVELPIAMRSLELWQEQSKVQIGTGFRRTGITYLADTDKEAANYAAWRDKAAEVGLQSFLLEGQALKERFPDAARSVRAALYTPSDGQAEPWLAAPAVAKAARAAGAKVLTGCAVRALDVSAGRVSGVVTERGLIRCSQVVVAAGAWSRLFLGNQGVGFPQLHICGTAMRIESTADVQDMPVGGGRFSYRKRADGGFTVAIRNANLAPITPDHFALLFDFLPSLMKSWRELRIRFGRESFKSLSTPRHWQDDEVTPFETSRILDPFPSEALKKEGLARLQAAFPAFADARLTHAWAGVIDVTPDAVPVIAPVEALPGLLLATGFSGHGFGLGPAAGELVSDLVQNNTPKFDPTPFAFSRFRQGRTSK